MPQHVTQADDSNQSAFALCAILIAFHNHETVDAAHFDECVERA
jgi:hypothetical protein